jgi:hypothetical protein
MDLALLDGAIHPAHGAQPGPCRSSPSAVLAASGLSLGRLCRILPRPAGPRVRNPAILTKIPLPVWNQRSAAALLPGSVACCPGLGRLAFPFSPLRLRLAIRAPLLLWRDGLPTFAGPRRCYGLLLQVLPLLGRDLPAVLAIPLPAHSPAVAALARLAGLPLRGSAVIAKRAVPVRRLKHRSAGGAGPSLPLEGRSFAIIRSSAILAIDLLVGCLFGFAPPAPGFRPQPGLVVFLGVGTLARSAVALAVCVHFDRTSRTLPIRSGAIHIYSLRKELKQSKGLNRYLYHPILVWFGGPQVGEVGGGCPSASRLPHSPSPAPPARDRLVWELGCRVPDVGLLRLITSDKNDYVRWRKLILGTILFIGLVKCRSA